RLLPAIPAAAIAACIAGPALAFPPAPFHRIHGMIRDDLGNPLGSGDAVVILSDADNREIVRAPTDAASGTGINYSLAVSMDHGLREKSREPDALQSAYPFTIRVVK